MKRMDLLEKVSTYFYLFFLLSLFNALFVSYNYPCFSNLLFYLYYYFF